MSLLSLHRVTASYGASQALFGVDLQVAPGEAVAFMGRNGMGKSTTVRCICRMLPAQGTLVFDGHDLSRLPSHRAARLGIGLVPEGRRCFRDLTVAENLVASARKGHWDQPRVETLFPRLAERRRQRAASLSGGEQQMLAIGRALMTNPRLLILDEATEGLAPTVRQEIWAAIARLKSETGMAMLVIDKSLKELRGACDRAVILERGRNVWQGPFEALTPEVSGQYLGV
ncbi:MAG: ABC transporter ATP-binding protein [Rhodobacteraceae bacterium]|jgi:branched-chain amino acid transport system ATP-binding protein|uniref:Amino acid/amide ABC transporter ATP-binding protein 2, HAAT family n=1 Tax=Salipiger profundus TaxID=1229727 RepID=A0A1U7D1F0_9RHOB|nr:MULTISPECIES: ABC transporter ATP-binding protein [Salipiger]APX21910.1 amino acid/amide ABC transporter ATP-binding protein 2, HAAT family [Salipiger profundus]MAB08090.1 ABC transporter ATP-binding protein [Paracoccaceae bacterium]GGA06173.1 ABC transporter ATP-binding protein [Salipiger profundus]SFC36812.1 amino acid/amide ABC transporter ATP-binding protein 2, HAAT family [Salipiger profundus]